MTADDRSCFRHRATIDGAKFAKAIVITNLQVGWLASILQILGALTNRAEGKEEIGSSDLGRASYGDVIFENASSADDHVRTYHAVGTDLGISGDFCAGDQQWQWDGSFEAAPQEHRGGSFVYQSEEQFALGHDFVVDDAFAGGLSQTLFGTKHFAMDEKGVPGKDRLPEFDTVGAHEVADFSGVFCLVHHDHAGHLGHGLHLKHARHHGMTGEVALKIWFVDRDGLHPHGLLFPELNDAIHHQERVAVRQDAHDFVDIEDGCQLPRPGEGPWQGIRNSALTRERAASVFGPWPGLIATTCPRRRRPLRIRSPMISRILWRTNSSGNRSGSLLSTVSPCATMAFSMLPPLISPLSMSGLTSS